MVRPADDADLRLLPMTVAYAQDVVTWAYPEPYGCYDMTDEDPYALADPANGFHAVLADDRLVGCRQVSCRLVGYRCFGPEGQVHGGDYGDSALDTGGGLRPDLLSRISATPTHGKHRTAPCLSRSAEPHHCAGGPNQVASASSSPA